MSCLELAIACWLMLGQCACPNAPAPIAGADLSLTVAPLSSDDPLLSDANQLRMWFDRYTQQAERLYEAVIGDRIGLSLNGNHQYFSRTNLCKTLSDRHHRFHDNVMLVSLTDEDCLAALDAPNLSNVQTWDRWAGYHIGTWVNRDRHPINDNALWNKSQPRMTLDVEGDFNRLGHPRIYDVQTVHFEGSQRQGIAQYGWNQSHPELPFVQGFDAKYGTMDPEMGTHIGFPFSKQTIHCILWLTTYEAYLECIQERPELDDMPVHRTSTGLSGYGQWTVQRLSSDKVSEDRKSSSLW